MIWPLLTCPSCPTFYHPPGNTHTPQRCERYIPSLRRGYLLLLSMPYRRSQILIIFLKLNPLPEMHNHLIQPCHSSTHPSWCRLWPNCPKKPSQNLLLFGIFLSPFCHPGVSLVPLSEPFLLSANCLVGLSIGLFSLPDCGIPEGRH